MIIVVINHLSIHNLFTRTQATQGLVCMCTSGVITLFVNLFHLLMIILTALQSFIGNRLFPNLLYTKITKFNA